MRGNKTHIHIENSRSSVEVFKANKKHVEDLFARNADLADKLDITIGSSNYDEIERWSKEDFKEYYGYMTTADILVGYSFPTADIETYAPNLRWIHFISSGVEHISPFNWVPSGMTLINNRGVHLPKSGESFATFLGMLNSAIPRLLTAQRNHKWDRVFTTIIAGKTLVILGVGHQGGEMARKAKEMGLQVIGIDPYCKEHPCCDVVVTTDKMQEVFADADFLAIAAPLTKETKGIIGKEQLGWLPAKAGVMNVSRGPLLDEIALHEKLCAGELSGAILDVFETEPLQEDSLLWRTPNLIITPHVSSDDLVNYIPLTLDLTIENYRNELVGKPLKNIVDTSREF
ncbi:MAG: D-2-hydroxyacid dehydrogenase [Synergistaceae bacterium]|nr:D-2-hydroxyacid dehydrogenase [Synergistaceae bacterium]